MAELSEGPTPSGGPRRRSLALDSSAVFVIGILIQLVGYIPTFFLARSLGLSLAGQALFGTVQTFLLMATSVSNLGDLRIGSAYTFFVSRGQPARESTSTYLLIRLAMVSVAGVALFALTPELHLAPPGVLPITLLEIVGVWMLFPLLWSTSTVYTSLWTSLGDAARGQIPTLIEVLVRSAALVYVALGFAHVTGHGTADPVGTLWGMTAAYVAGALASTVVSIPSLLRFRGRIRADVGRRMFRWSLPLMGSMVLLYFSGNLISLIIIPFLGTQQFNIFNAANAFRILALALPSAIAIPLFPHISSLHKQEAFEAIRARSWQTVRFTAILVVPGVLALVVYRVNLLNILYSATYIPGANALAILALAAIPASLSQIIATTMTSIGRTRLELYITSLQVALLAGIALLIVQPHLSFAPAWLSGINGAGVAVLVSSLGAFALNAYFLYSLLGVRLQVGSIATIVVSSVASFFAVSRLNDLLPINRYYQLAAGFVLGFAVYLVVLALVGELSKEDVGQVVHSLGLPASLGRALAGLCWRVTSRPVNPLPPGGGRALVPLEAEWLREEGSPPEVPGGPPGTGRGPG